MTYQNFASLGVNLNRQKYGPLDISSVFTSAADLQYYLTKGAFTEGVSEYWYKNANEKVVPYPYEGQVLATVIDGDTKVYVLRLDAEGNFEAKAIEPEVDGKTVKLTNGKLELVGLPTDTSKVYVPSLVNGVLTWAEPDTSTAEGQQQAIEGLTTSVAGLAEVINGKAADEEAGTEAVVGLVDKVAALEAVDNATQAELDAYKEVVTAAIAAGVKEAKDYADANDANTVYDDTELAGRVKVIEDDYLKAEDKYDDSDLQTRVKAIEDDYLKEADKYDDTELAGRVTTIEGKVAGLEAAVEAIDFVDSDELADAIKDFATDSEVEAGLALKADKAAFEDLKGTVDAFLTGEGTEAALDSLKELIAYIDEHDGADLTEMIATIEGIENKLEGVESTVVAHVTAAIEAIKIGDYAKAADLTELAGKVEALEAKPFDTYATKTEVEAVDAKFVDYTTTEDLEDLLSGKVDSSEFDTFKTNNTAAIATAKSEAIAAAAEAEEAKGYAVDTEVAETYATKAEVSEAVEGIENDLLAYAKTDDVEAELAKKIETGSIAHSSESAAEGVTVEGTKLNIVVDAYTKSETRDYVAEVIKQMTGGESAADVLRDLNAHITTYTEKVGQIDAKNNAQDTAIATAQAQADKGVADAAKVAGDLSTLAITVADNTREISVVDGKIDTVNETLAGKISALEGKDSTIEGNITALQTTVGGHTTTITEQGIAIAALQEEDSRLAILIQGNTDKFAGYYTKEEANDAIKAAIDAIPEVSFDGYATEKYVDDAIVVVNEEVAKKANAADVYSKTDADAKFLTEAQVDARLNTLIDGANSEDTITNVTNLVEFVNNNAGDIAKLVTDVENNGKAIKKNADDIAGINTSISSINNAIAAIVQPKASEEVTVAEDGTLGLGKVSVNKLYIPEGDTLVLDGGAAK